MGQVGVDFSDITALKYWYIYIFTFVHLYGFESNSIFYCYFEIEPVTWMIAILIMILMIMSRFLVRLSKDREALFPVNKV